jgi:hypothetical protein
MLLLSNERIVGGEKPEPFLADADLRFRTVRQKAKRPDTGGSRSASIAATDPPRDDAAPLVLFLNGDVAAATLVAIVSALFTQSVPAAGLIGAGTILLPTLTPALAALIALLLGIAHADLRTTIGSDAELDLGLGQRRRGDEET